MTKTALLIVDVQNYFLNGHTSHLPEKIAAHISVNHYDYTLFTKFVNQKDSNFEKMLGWNKCSKPPETNISSLLECYVKSGQVFEKHTLSAFKNLELKRFLDSHHITKLFICGTDSEACVLSTAFEAFDFGYETHILKDLCASTNGKDFHEYARTIIERNLEPKK
jgi:nicotinamidase-related amidase